MAPTEPDDPTSPLLEPAAGTGQLRRIGVYDTVRELGHGGMGTVFLGVRADEVYQRRVAIKVVRGPDSADVVRRFHQERRILASLDHPNIAKLLDGGTTEDGLPYFVMEYVEGERIDAYCDRQGLPTAERLKLFRNVCAAVQYAHRNLVVHRDLKPANILVTADGTVKLLDFGIAKLLNPEASSDGLTGTQLALTPDYASPEQARAEAITTATDVYSLGVVLYELLTGRRPYRLKSRQALEVLRAVVEDEPERPSVAVGTTEPLRRRLRGDLDNIVLMALRKSPSMRYSSAEALGEDIARHLEGQPVAARNPTPAYRAGKFVRRHAWGVAMAVLAVTLIVGSTVATARQSQRTRVALEKAEKERVKAETVSAFLVDLFKVSDPSEARGRTITARDVLDKGADRIASELEDQPEVRATLQTAVGDVYRSLGHLDKALPLLRESLATRRQVLGNAHPDVAATLTILGDVFHAKGDFPASVQAHEEALHIRRRVLGPDHVAVATSLSGLARALAYSDMEPAKVEALHHEAIALHRRLLGDRHPDVANAMNNLSTLYIVKGRNREAAQLLQEVLAMRREAFATDHPLIATSLMNLGNALTALGELEEAERLYREALALRTKLLGPEHTQMGTVLNNLGILLNEKDDAPAAEIVLREALRIQRKALGSDNPRTASVGSTLADSLVLQGKLQEAEPLYREALRVLEPKMPPTHPLVIGSKLWLGILYMKKGDFRRAEPLLRECVAARRKTFSAGHPSLADAESTLGECLAATGQRAEARPLLESGYKGLRAGRGDTRSTREALRRLKAFQQAGGDAQ